MEREYSTPGIISEKCFENSALACGKTTDPPPGSWHLSSAFDTFTGHFHGFTGYPASQSGAVGLGYGYGGTSKSYPYSGLCTNWVLYSS